jgi:glycine cleavage system aminomethyltransferase T
MAYVDKNFNEVGSKIFVDMKGNRKKSKLVEAEVIGFPTYDTKIYGLNRDE